MSGIEPGARIARSEPAPVAAALMAGVLLALLSVPDAHAEVPSVALKGDWVEVRTRNFTVFGNSGPGDASDMARRLERLREVLIATHPTLDAPIPGTVRIYAFRGEGPFRPYHPRGTEHAAGFNTPVDDGDLIAYDAGLAESEGIRILYHEYAHSIVRQNFVRVPTWLNEGLAEYYSTFATGDASAEIGRTVPHMLTWLRGHPLMPLEQLFAITMDSPDYREGSRRTTFYAESWALVHFLSQRSPEQARRFQRFMARLRRGNPPLEAFTEVAPREGWPALLRELVEYSGQLTHSYWNYTFAGPFASVEQQTRPLPRAEVLFRLGELAAQVGDEGDRLAEQHFRLALAADSLHAGAMASLGLVLDRRGDAMHAESLYTVAAETAPADPVPWVLAGRGAFQRYRRGQREARSSAAIGASRARFARALQLDPGNVEALIGFGRSYTQERVPPASAASALGAASALLPARVDVACDLASLLARMDRCAEADSVFREKVEPLGEADIKRSIAGSVFACWLARASKLEDAGRHADAQRVLSDAIASTRDTACIALARARLDAPGQSEPPPERGSATRTPVGLPPRESLAAFQRGVRAANQGRYDEAIPELERARELAGDSDFRQTVSEMLASVRARARLGECIALINAGELARAKSRLDELAGGPLDDSTRAYVTRLRERTDARIALQRGVRSATRGDFRSAGGVYDSLLARRLDADLRDYALALDRQVDARLEIQPGIELLRAGRLREARAHFEALLKHPMSAGMRASVAAFLTHTEGRLELERALTLVRAGEVEDARKVLVAVLATPVAGNLRAYVEGLLRQLAPEPGR